MKKQQLAAVIMIILLVGYSLFFGIRFFIRMFEPPVTGFPSSTFSFGFYQYLQLVQQTISILINILLLVLGATFLLHPETSIKDKVYKYLRFIFIIDFFIYLPFRIISLAWIFLATTIPPVSYFLSTFLILGVQITTVVFLFKNKPVKQVQRINLADYELVAYTSMGHRFVHYLIDFLFLIPMIFAWISYSQNVFGFRGYNTIIMQLMISVIYLLYCFLSEVIFKQTLGKMITNSCVVSTGPDPSSGRMLVRTLCRLIPFDGISFLFGGNWHDKASSTSVVYVDTWQRVFEETDKPQTA